MSAAWVPLESNPEVLNKYMYKLGVPEKWSIVDVYGLDDDMLEFLPRPVKSLILLFPCSDAYEKHRSEEDVALKADPPAIPENLFYMKQLVHNACGTVALVHALANSDIELNDGVLKSYLDKTKTLSPAERGSQLESDTAFTDVHHELAMEGQTAAPNPEDKVNNHFVAIIEKDGELYEMDGRKSFPVKHGAATAENFLSEAAKVCKKFIARDPDDVRFTVIALAATQKD